MPLLGTSSHCPVGLGSGKYDPGTNDPLFLFFPWPPAQGVISVSGVEARAGLLVVVRQEHATSFFTLFGLQFRLISPTLGSLICTQPIF